ncbi:MAG: class I SAM-dependent methyltransferase [Candidatus Berkelbacteria bacterium]|nr:class I SAM-dependent methyltransferase [Candidatus Berkelbacteria bacterium]
MKARTVGVTPSAEAVKRLLEIVDKDGVFMELKHGSPLDLPFADGEFGQVISIDLLHWLHGWRRAIAEIARVAAEGASIFICMVSYTVRHRGPIDLFAVVETLTKNGVDVQRFDTFSAEKSQSPRLFVSGVKQKKTKGKPSAGSPILIPREVGYEGP